MHQCLPNSVQKWLLYDVKEGPDLVRGENAIPSKMELCEKFTRTVVTGTVVGMGVMAGYVYGASTALANHATGLAQQQFLTYVNGLPNEIPGNNGAKVLNMSKLPVFTNDGGFSGEQSETAGLEIMLVACVLGGGLLYCAGKALYNTALDYKDGTRYHGYQNI